MCYRLKLINGLVCAALLAVISVQVPALAKSAAATAVDSETNRYIVILVDMPLAIYDGRAIATSGMVSSKTQLLPTAISLTGDEKLDVRAPASLEYLSFLEERFQTFKHEAQLKLGRQINPVHIYRNVLNGLAVDLTDAEAGALLDLPMVTAVEQETLLHIQTDAGPTWLGADKIHNGSSGHPETGGEDVIVGVLDTGINWDHPSFEDPGQSGTGWNHVNPYGTQLGLCSDPEVLCNDKLIGVYDFVEDDPDTEWVEENTKGKDPHGHGSHTSSTAAGNRISFNFRGLPTSISGVAPNANIVSYRVCFEPDPNDPDAGGGCKGSVTIKALDQAVVDAIDVINYSAGGDPFDPWSQNGMSMAFLNARAAGIFVATSAGNSGPDAGTINSPANAPWITAVGNATHDRVYGVALENLSGGNTAVPDDLFGTSLVGGLGVRRIVHAKDFGNAFCGTGTAELGPNCSDNTGASNPFAANTFNGEIVVCDRGTYGRIEKGKNVLLAGAGGMILANTDAQGGQVNSDQHCLPATHLVSGAGNELRAWLDSGSNHQGSLSDYSSLRLPEAGDVIAASSSRGPNLSPAENIMKPDVIAPGTDILAAWYVNNNVNVISGTSMSSPHVAGAGALLKSVHPDWSPAAIASALTMTATTEQSIDSNGSEANVHKQGGGRPRLDQAVNAALYLNETETGFRAANPRFGGNPKNLNLPGLVDSYCVNSCSFQRRVTDLAGGASWTASAEDLPDGVTVSISPNNFNLANGADRQLTIDVDVSNSGKLFNWMYGKVRLKSNGHPDAVFPLAVFYDTASLPSELSIETDKKSGWEELALSDFAYLPDATYTTGGLIKPTRTVELLPQDPSDDLVYDNNVGVMTVWHTVTADTLWLHTETLESSAEDLDLFVGLDANGDGIAQESEELCSSTTPIDIEFCDLFTPAAGEYWIRVQNWDATLDPDEATLISAVVNKDTSSLLTATGNGIVPPGDSFKVRLSWDNANIVPGMTLYGAFGLGTHRENPNNLGVTPITFTKTAVAEAETLVLMNGISRGLTLAANTEHKRMFVDVPPGVDSLEISASGADSTQNTNLDIELYRVDFDALFADAPFAAAVNTSGSPAASASGSSNNGPTVTVNGGTLVPGRWYAVLKNTQGQPSAIDVVANMTFSGEEAALRNGLWESSTRGNIASGYDYSSTGGFRALVWYTYDEAGDPAWYIGSAREPESNVWTASLLHVTNDGALQQSKSVGHISVTMLEEGDAIYSFTLFGEDGSDRIYPSLQPGCPVIDGSKKSYDGHWARDNPGVGGATVIVNSGSQAFIHYIYDAEGAPVWLIGSPSPQSATVEESVLKQLGGFCPTCAESPITTADVGVFSREFQSEERQTWSLDYVLQSPLLGSVERTDETGKLTVKLNCP